MDTVTLEELETQVVRADCPACCRRELELRIQCRFDRDEALYVVHCKRCNALYEIDWRAIDLARERPYVEGLLRSLVCPRCQSHDVRLIFQCDLSTRECTYRTSCRECGAVA